MSALDSLGQPTQPGKRPRTVPLHWLLLSLMPAMDALSMLAVAAGVHGLVAGTMADAGEKYSIAILSFAVLVILAFEIQGMYEPEVLIPPQSQLASIITTSLGISSLVLGSGYFSGFLDESAATWGCISATGGTALLILYRFSIHGVVRRAAIAGQMRRKIVLVGFGEQARHLHGNLQSGAQPWNHVLGVFDDRTTDIEPVGSGQPIQGNLDELVNFVRVHDVEDVVIALPWNAGERIGRIVASLEDLPVNVHLRVDLAGFRLENPACIQIGQTSLLNVRRKPLDGWKGVIKLLEDKMVGILIILALGPLMLFIALAIKIESKGPVLFRQPRYGLNNRVFEIYKFRTMYHDCPPDPEIPQATKNDRRVTKVGRALRRTSLDELPQVFNVLQGSMSVVGPRPHAVSHNEYYARVVRGYFSRHRVRPGITGWAQVNGFRGETDTPDKMAARVHYDVSYIENWSLAFDIKVLVRTIFVGFIHPNAY